jgi:predicted Rdx family selenoprotein
MIQDKLCDENVFSICWWGENCNRFYKWPSRLPKWGNIQNVLTLVIMDPGGGGVTAILFTGMYHWRIDWMGFNATFSSISAAWRIENRPKLRGNFAILKNGEFFFHKKRGDPIPEYLWFSQHVKNREVSP